MSSLAISCLIRCWARTDAFRLEERGGDGDGEGEDDGGESDRFLLFCRDFKSPFTMVNLLAISTEDCEEFGGGNE